MSKDEKVTYGPGTGESQVGAYLDLAIKAMLGDKEIEKVVLVGLNDALAEHFGEAFDKLVEANKDAAQAIFAGHAAMYAKGFQRGFAFGLCGLTEGHFGVTSIVRERQAGGNGDGKKD